MIGETQRSIIQYSILNKSSKKHIRLLMMSSDYLNLMPAGMFGFIPEANLDIMCAFVVLDTAIYPCVFQLFLTLFINICIFRLSLCVWLCTLFANSVASIFPLRDKKKNFELNCKNTKGNKSKALILCCKKSLIYVMYISTGHSELLTPAGCQLAASRIYTFIPFR